MFHRFLHWWASELKALVPRETQVGRSRPARRLVLSVEGARRRVILEKGGQSETLGETAEGGLIDLVSLIKERPNLPVGLRLGDQYCFSRLVELPAQAEDDFSRILELDLERTTPFRSVDVLTAHYVMPGVAAPRSKRAVRHLVVKRKTIEPLLDEMRGLGIEPAFADCWGEDHRAGLPINFLARTGQSGERRSSRFVPAIAALAVALALSAAAILIVRYQDALETLEARTAAAKGEAEAVRLAMAASETASAQIAAMTGLIRARLSIARILEELTATMPDSAWVSDLRIDGNVIEFTGFAKSAAALVPILENSPLFNEVNLTSPIIFDNIQGQERFSLRLRLSKGTFAPDTTAESAPQEGAKL